jgi:hypothetical protein
MDKDPIVKQREMTDNELIAEFMGIKIDPVGRTSYDENGRKRMNEVELEYDNSWDWLMPVVEKIERLDDAYDTRICFHADEGAYFCDIVDQENNELACQSSYTATKIEVVYKAVVEFIEWYNS